MGIDHTFDAGKAQTGQAFVLGVQLDAGGEESGNVLLRNSWAGVSNKPYKTFTLQKLAELHGSTCRGVAKSVFHQVCNDPVFKKRRLHGLTKGSSLDFVF